MEEIHTPNDEQLPGNRVHQEGAPHRPPPPPPSIDITELRSANKAAWFVFQGDGNLVLYVLRNGAWVPRWDSGTCGSGGSRCVMQGDGNLVIYHANGQPLWSSNTWGHPGASLAVQDDENVVIYHRGVPLWATDTWVAPPVRSAFVPSVHGLHFVNNFPDSVFKIAGVFELRSPGLCGGMSYTALDYFRAGRTVPSDNNTPPTAGHALGEYIKQRQWDSVMGSWHGAKFFSLALNPDDHALNLWSTHDEWSKLRAEIDSGRPVPLGLLRHLDLSKSHQVVACGYQDGNKEKRIFCYDPNHPNVESVLTVRQGNAHWFEGSGEEWRGFFVESGYSPRSPV